jgi:FtsP/CotA-like multicopper oxidase with cupredoxin domain
VVIPPAGRAEFVVSSPASGTSTFRTTCFDTGPAGDPNPSQALATIALGTPNVATVPQTIPTPAAAIYQQPLGAAAQQRTVIFSENDSTGQFFLNQTQYSAQAAPMFTVNSGTVEQWALENTAQEVHVFHIHQTHFIVQDIDGVTQPAILWDTFTLPIAHSDGTPSITHVLIDFRDPIIRGTFLFHCHIVSHEDNGMMAKVLVQ